MAEDLKVAVILTGEAAVRAGLTSIAQETKKVAAETKAASAETKSYASTTLPSVRSVTDALGQQVAQLRAQAAAMRTPEHQAYMRSQQALRAEIEALTRATTNQGTAVQGVSSSLSAAQAPTRSLSASWADLAGKWFLASQAIGLVGGAVSSLVEDSAKWQMVRNSISDTEGSASKAAGAIKSLVEAAKLPGLDLQPLSKGYVGFRSLNIEGEKAVRTMKAFGNAIALAGGGANEFERVNRQFLQMLGKGRVLQEDISIIAESMPRIRELTKEAFGTYDIEKIRESGVTANEFVDAVVAAAEKLPQASGNIKNSLDNASTAMSQFRDQLMPDEGIQGAVDGWTNEIEAFTALFKAIASPIDTARGAISAIRDEMYRTTGMTGEWLQQQKRARDLYGIDKEGGSADNSMAMSAQSAAAYAMGGAALSKDNLAKWWEKEAEKTKDRHKALNEASKSLAKTDLAVALQIEREKWKGKLALFQEGSEEYNKILRAQAAEEARIRKQFAPKGGESEDKRIARHNLASEANVERNFDGSVTMRDWDDPNSESRKGHDANRAKAEAARDRSEEKALAERIKAQKDYTKLVQDENEKRLKAEQDYWRAVEQAATSSIDNVLQTIIMGSGSMESKMSALFDQGMSSLISSGVSMLMGAAFAPATGGTSLAVPAGMEFLTSIMGVHRANGGQVMGGFIGNENARSGGEYYTPNTPGRIYNSTQQTTNNIGGAVIHIHAGGGSAQSIAREVAKILPRASNLSTSNRSQTSRSGR